MTGASPMIRLSDSKRRTRLVLALLLTASLVVITVDFRASGDGFFDRLGRGVMTVLGPLQTGVRRVFHPIGSFFTGLGRVPTLQHRIELLHRELALLRAREAQVTDVYRENASLRELLALRERFGLDTIAAQVIAVGPSNLERTVFVDAGTRDGVRKGMPVISGDGLVGRVFRAGATTAEILLIVDRSSEVAGRLVATGETGVVQGRGDDLSFEILNPYSHVKVDDSVVTAGYDGGVFPAGIPMGQVESIPPGHGALSRTVVVRPAVDFARLDYVLVVKPARGTRPAAPRASPTAKRSPSASPSATPSGGSG